MKKKVLLLCALVLTVQALSGAGAAQNIEEQIVTGNTYNTFFYTLVDVFNVKVSFHQRIGFVFEGFQGNGYYLAFANSFVGIYFAVNESLGSWNGDITIIMLGINQEPFIVGTGVVWVEYQEIYPLIFQGLNVLD